MEKLRKITISTNECYIDPGRVNALQECLPELTVVILANQTQASLATWSQDSKYDNVEQLFVSVISNESIEEDDGFFISPSVEIMSQMRQSFPNIWNLSLTFNFSDLTGLSYLFKNMVQLESLKIKIVEITHDDAHGSSADVIDSEILGLALGNVIALKRDMQLLETSLTDIQEDGESCIRNLSGM